MKTCQKNVVHKHLFPVLPTHVLCKINFKSSLQFCNACDDFRHETR